MQKKSINEIFIVKKGHTYRLHSVMKLRGRYFDKLGNIQYISANWDCLSCGNLVGIIPINFKKKVKPSNFIALLVQKYLSKNYECVKHKKKI